MSVLVAAKFPSVAAVFTAFAASLFLFLLARVMFCLMRSWYHPLARTESQEKMGFFLLSAPPTSRATWQWGPPTPLPLSFNIPEKPASHARHAVGPPPKRSMSQPASKWLHRPCTPQFQPPRQCLGAFLLNCLPC